MGYPNKKHVLLVGGDSSWVNLATLALQPFDTSRVEGGNDAIALLESRTTPIDALLTDTRTASALLKWTRQNREELPVIVMPAQPMDEEAYFLDLGALSVVRPQTPEKLTSLLDVYFALAPN